MKKSKKETTKPKNETHIASIVFDCTLTAILIVISFLDAFIFKIKFNNYLNLEKISSIVITLLPSIITIVSISLSISKEKIYGVTINEINSLRGSFYFNFLHMVLIMCSLIGVYSLLVVFGLTISVYCLEGISLIYSIVFAIQEIPLMLYSKRRVSKILKHYYLTNKSGLLFENQKSEIFNAILLNITLTEGIDVSYKMLEQCDKNNSEFLNLLLSLQNEFYWSTNENVTFKSVTPSDVVKGIPLIDQIDAGYGNIDNVCFDRDTFQISSIKYFQITRTLFSLHSLCKSINLEKKEKAKLISLLSRFSLISEESNTYALIISVLIAMNCYTLNDGETWFIEVMRDNDWGQIFLFDFKKRPIGIFLSMILAHLYFKSGLSKSDKEKLISFINQPDAGINANGRGWKMMFNTSLEFANVNEIVNSLPYFLKCYESVDEPSFYFHGKTKRMVYECKENFNKADIFHDWLLMVFYANNYLCSSENLDLKLVLSALDDKDKYILANELSENWLDFDCNKSISLKSNIETSFFNMYSLELSPYLFNAKLSEQIVDQLIKFHDDVYMSKENKRHDSLDINLDDETQKIIHKFTNLIEKKSIFDKRIDLRNAKKQCFNVLVPSEGIDIALDSFIERAVQSITLMICDDIKSKVKPITYSGYEISDEVVNDILTLNPNFTTFNYKIKAYISNKEATYSKQLEQLKIENISDLYLDLCWKKNAIQFNIQLDTDYHMVRRLNDNELEYYIDQNNILIH